MKGAFITFIIFFLAAPGMMCVAQSDGASKQSISINGSSNMHDWVMHAEEVVVKGDISSAEDDGTWKVSALTVEIPVEKIKSEKGSIMDKKTYKALMSEVHPVIRFNVPGTTVLTTGKANKVQGSLRVAGVTKTIDLAVDVRLSPAGDLVCSGQKDMKMTDFKVDPPTALMGAMKTTDEITIEFNVTLSNF